MFSHLTTHDYFKIISALESRADIVKNNESLSKGYLDLSIRLLNDLTNQINEKTNNS